MSEFPDVIWDGSSRSRDPSNGVFRAPDANDWNRCISEVAAAQRRINDNYHGLDDDIYDTIGTPLAAGLSTLEKGGAGMHKTRVLLNNVIMQSVDGVNPVTDGAWATLPIYQFPNGFIKILAGTFICPIGGFTTRDGAGGGFSDSSNFELGFGTTPSAQQTAFGLVNGLQENTVEAVPVYLDSGTTILPFSNATVESHGHNGVASPIIIHMNMRTLIDSDHGVTPDELYVSGILTLLWAGAGGL